MKNIQIKILNHNFNGMPIFLAMLTQRGHTINNIEDLMTLYNKVINISPSKSLLELPHNTIKRMNYLTIAIVGLSTKAVSQLRTHATRLTFISTSTQYSSYENRENNWVMPDGLSEIEKEYIQEAYDKTHYIYTDMINAGVDKDKAGYVLPQGLRKTLIMSGNLDEWQYVIQTRMCRRNTLEVQYIMKLLYKEIINICGPEYIIGMLPKCVYGKCQEGKLSCGKPFIEGVE